MYLKINTLCVFVLLTFVLQAQQTVWTGQKDAAWLSSENWSNGLPNSEKEAIIPSSLNERPFPEIDEDLRIDYAVRVGGILRIKSGKVVFEEELQIWGSGEFINRSDIEVQKRFRIAGKLENHASIIAFTGIDLIGTLTNFGILRSAGSIQNREGLFVNKQNAVLAFQGVTRFMNYSWQRAQDPIFEDCSWIMLPDWGTAYLGGDLVNYAQEGAIIVAQTNTSNTNVDQYENDGAIIRCSSNNFENCVNNSYNLCTFPSNLYQSEINTTWTGIQSEDFADNQNWTNGLPNFYQKGIIPNTPQGDHYPSVNEAISINAIILNQGQLRVEDTLRGIGGFELINQGELTNSGTIILPSVGVYPQKIELTNSRFSQLDNHGTIEGGILNAGKLTNGEVGRILSNTGSNEGEWQNNGFWNVNTSDFVNEEMATILNNGRIQILSTTLRNVGIIRNQTAGVLTAECDVNLNYCYSSKLRNSAQLFNEGKMYFFNGGELISQSNNALFTNNGQVQILGEGDFVSALDITATSDGILQTYTRLRNNANGEIKVNGLAYFRDNNQSVTDNEPNLDNKGSLEIGRMGYVLFGNNSFIANRNNIVNEGTLELGTNESTDGFFNNFGVLQNLSKARIIQYDYRLNNFGRIENESCAIFVSQTGDIGIGNFQNEGIFVYDDDVPELASSLQGNGTGLACDQENYEVCLGDLADCETTVENPNYWTGAVSQAWFEGNNWSNGLPDSTQIAVVPAEPDGARFPVINERGDLPYHILNEGEITFNSLTNTLQNGMTNRGYIEITTDATLVQTGDSLIAIQNYGEIKNDGVLLLNGWLFNHHELQNNKRLWLGGYIFSQGRAQYFIALGYLRNFENFQSNEGSQIEMGGDWDNYGEAIVAGSLKIQNGNITNYDRLELTSSSFTEASSGLWYGTSASINNWASLDIAGTFLNNSNEQTLFNYGETFIRPCALYEGGRIFYGENALLENAGIIQEVAGVEVSPHYLAIDNGIANCGAECGGIDESIEVRVKMGVQLTLGENNTAILTSSQLDDGSTTNRCGGEILRIEVIPSLFDCESVGTQSVKLRVYDRYGNYNESSTEVEILPSENCGQSNVTINCNFNYLERVEMNHPDGYRLNYTPIATATTDCLEGIVSVQQITGPALAENVVLPVGNYLFVFEAVDACGGTATCEWTLEVQAQDYAFDCPEDITVRIPIDATGAIVEYPLPTANLLCGGMRNYYEPNYSPNLPSGSFFPLGTTSILIEYEDYCENTYSCSFNVTIERVNLSEGTDLELELEVENNMPRRYTNTVFTARLVNAGTETATNVVVDFPIPDSLAYTKHNTTKGNYRVSSKKWEIPSIAPGEFADLELELYVLENLQSLPVFVQISELDQTDIDSTPNNATCCEANEDDEAVVRLVAMLPGGDLPAPDTNTAQIMSSIYPSPTNTVLHLRTDITAPYQLKVWNVAGQIQAEYLNLENRQTQELDVSNYENGIYFLSIENDTTYEILRFVKQ